ncbi:MAG: Translocation and assembly module TamA [Chlamydiae bacterium]|nr:Translocation and assembly module TamA [Chlamydiota bacterium]
MASLWKKATFSFILPATLWGAGISYSVDFEGLDDPKTLKTLRSSSQLVTLRKKPPSSINALRFRAESDVPELIHTLHAHGYLEAQVDIRIDENLSNYDVHIDIDPGPLYRIQEYQIEYDVQTSNKCDYLKLEELGIDIGDPAETKKILDSELCALQILSERGYPLATVKNREIVADGITKKVKVFLLIDTGPLSHFGSISIEGNVSVSSSLIEQQIQWLENDPYNSCLVEGMQQALMDTSLFSSVYITHGERLENEALLPMKVEVAETKHKSISLGTSYQTTYGPGGTIGWENRNVGGLGRKIMIQADIAQRNHSGIASYLIPNFHRVDQNYIMQAQAHHESIKPYRMQSYSFFNRFDRQIGDHFSFSAGPKLEYLMVTNSVDNGNFLLVEGPLYLRWTNVCDFLNPISGIRFEYRSVPAINIKDIADFYYSQVLSLSSYLPIFGEDTLVLAQKITLGTIFSNGIGSIPVPNRFFGGSEDNLRGYKYYTVSPLDDDDKPIGGRSAVYYSLEPRFRVSKYFGIVPFFDMGNVYLEQLPTFKGKWRKSTGMGVRYYSLVGPLRLDVAFPLNRREGIDPHWWIFVSLGQTF